MAMLQSKLFASDTRLEQCAVQDSAHLTLGVVGEFVSKVQLALQLIDGATIDPAEFVGKRYGPSTAKSVLTFKQKRSIINPTYQTQADDIVGKMTIVRLDAEMVEHERRSVPPPPAPIPPKPRPLEFEEAKQAIATYLKREARHNVAEILLNHESNLLVFGEVHNAGDPMKAFLFSELVGRTRLRRPHNTHFHASERYENNEETRDRISAVLHSSPMQMGRAIARLPERVRPFGPVLASANSFPNHRYGIIPSDQSPLASEDQRHGAIFSAFNEAVSKCPDIPLRSINSATSRGNILLGARHAARRSVIGHAALTTTARLSSAGWRVHAIRLTVPFAVGDKNIIPDDFDLRVLGTQDDGVIDGLAIVNQVSDRNFYADLTKPDSPFGRLKLKESGANDIPVNTLYDALVHLGGPASL